MKKFITRLMAIAAIAAMALCTSCHKDDDEVEDKGKTDTWDFEVEGQTLAMEGFSVQYPEDHTFKAVEVDDWRYGDYEFSQLVAFDSTDRAVRTVYMESQLELEKETVKEIEQILDENFYSEDGKYALIEKKQGKLGSNDALIYLSNGRINEEYGWYDDSYREQYIMYNANRRRIMIATIEVAQDVKSERLPELKKINSTLRLK